MLSDEANDNSILITGVNGFIGRGLTVKLLNNGYSIIGLDLINNHNGFTNKKYKFYKFNLLKDNLDNFLQDAKISWVFHLAGVASSRLCEEQPELAFKTNTQSCIRLLTQLSALNMNPHVVLASSSEVYGTGAITHALKETSILNPTNIYGLTKKVAEEVWTYFSRILNFHSTIFRFSNTYGRKSAKEGYLVEYLIDSVKNNKEVRLRTPNRINHYLYVEDHINAYLALLENPKAGVFNIAGPDYFSVKQILTIVDQKIKNGHITQYPKPISQGEGIILDINKAKSILDWVPKYSFYDGLSTLLK